MGEKTGISWTDHTFNPWWGCVKVSPGCVNCYAETFAKRVGNDVWGVNAPWRFFKQDHWNEPLKWNAKAKNERKRVFCGSMCDWAEIHHDKMYNDEMNKARKQLAWTVNETPNLDWLFLTKRIDNAGNLLADMFGSVLPENLWIGCTVENQEQANRRIPLLREIPAHVLFLSCEPLLEPVDLDLLFSGISWVIVGGESGHKARPFKAEWAEQTKEECAYAGVAFFFKQHGGNKKIGDVWGGHELNGKVYHELP